ncbi:MAG: hypothetical protein SVM86_04170 [Candidatus Cloacimonadota bacterium]|nr:hypothetical protein [Candidatus Cloacimonadota bacterium]
MNWLLNNSSFQNPAVITTGRDGEEQDLVGGHKKPKIKLPANTFFTCFSYTIKKMTPSIKVIQKTPFIAINKPLWLAQSLFPIETEVVGPASVSKQILLAKFIWEHGADHIFIDGSLDRRAIASSSIIKNIFLVAGAQKGNLEKITSQLENLVTLSTIPKLSIQPQSFITFYKKKDIIKSSIKNIYGNEKEISLYMNASQIYFPGALTDRSFERLKNFFPKFKGKLVFNHPFVLQISNKNLKFLKEHTNIFCVNGFDISALALNSFSPAGNHINCKQMREQLRRKFPNLLIFDTKEVSYEQ